MCGVGGRASLYAVARASPQRQAARPRGRGPVVIAAFVALVGLFALAIAVPFLARRVVRRHDALASGVLPSGGAMVTAIAAAHELDGLTVEEGDIDCYLAQSRTIQLADGRLTRSSVSAVAIAAHEAGHAQQHRDGYGPWRLWWALVLPALGADWIALFLLPWLLIFDSVIIAAIVLVLFAFVALAGLVSSVVEIDATRRAMADLRAQGVGEPHLRPARRVLVACGATYVAESVLDIGFILRRLAADEEEGGFAGGGDGDFGGGAGGGD